MRLLVLVMLFSAMAAPVEPPRARVSIALVPRGVAAAEVVVTLRPAQRQDGAPEQPLQRRVSPDDPLVLDLSPGAWQLVVEDPAFWHPPVFFTASPSEQNNVAIPLWPASAIAGSVVHRAKVEPREMLVRFVSSDIPPQLSGETACPIANNAFRCAMPAGTFNVRMRPKGFIAHYRSEIPLPPGQTLDVGRLELREGQSITGRVQLPRGVEQDAMFKVRVSAAPAGSTDRTLAIETTPVKNGFFQLDGVAPGAYIVRARMGRSLYTLPVEVTALAGREAELVEPLALNPPRRIRLDITPATNSDGARWHVRLSREGRSGHLENVVQSSASPAGLWESPALPPARYTAEVGTLGGDRWHQQEIDLGAEDAQEIVQLAQQTFRGSVMMAERPVAASLSFRGSGFEVKAKSDEEGRFSVALPASPGTGILVGVESDAPYIKRTKRVTLPEEGKTIDIVLPGSVLMGRVVDNSEKPVPGAIVSILGGDAWEILQQPVSGTDGKFEAYGMAAGTYRVFASGFLTESAPVTVEVKEDDATTAVRLVMADAKMLRGRVLSAMGPVPAARLKAISVDVPQYVLHTRETNGAGHFSIALPPQTRIFDVFVAAPGFAYVIRRGILSERPLDVVVEQRGGTLVLQAQAGASLYLVHNDGVAGAGMVERDWGGRSRTLEDGGRELVVSMMEPGSYSACLVAPELYEVFRNSSGRTGGVCRSGFLPPSGTLTLDVRAMAK